MKYNAIVDSGIPILKRYDIPDHLIPPVCPFTDLHIVFPSLHSSRFRPRWLSSLISLQGSPSPVRRADRQDSQVEIDAKIAAGYFGGAKDVKAEDLHLTVGRAWEDLEH